MRQNLFSGSNAEVLFSASNAEVLSLPKSGVLSLLGGGGGYALDKTTTGLEFGN